MYVFFAGIFHDFHSLAFCVDFPTLLILFTIYVEYKKKTKKHWLAPIWIGSDIGKSSKVREAEAGAGRGRRHSLSSARRQQQQEQQ